MKLSWQTYTLGEAFTKIASSVFQKLAGLATSSPPTALIYSAIIGIVQIFAGFSFRRKEALVTHKKDLWLSLLLGFFGAIANVLGPVAFMYGADLAGRTFLVTMSVVPGMLIGRFFFGQKLNTWQYFGIAVFVLGAWAILDGPDVLTLVKSPPTWVWLTLIVTVTNGISEGLRSGMTKNYSPMVNNFWVGVSSLFFSLGLFIGLMMWGGIVDVSDVSLSFLAFSVITGMIVVVMISMSLLALQQEGALIALKKTLMNSVYLAGAMVAGWILFGETITPLKWLGVLLFAVAFILTDNRARNMIVTLFKKVTRQTS